jgi:copper chaperone
MKLQQKSKQKTGEEMTTKTYLVPNINCMHCVHTIKMELEELKGVQEVKGDAATKIVEVVFEPPATDALIIETLKGINYPPQD